MKTLFKNKKILIIVGGAILFVAVLAIVLANVLGGHRLIRVESHKGNVSYERRSAKNEVNDGMNLVSKDKVYVGEASQATLLIDSDKHVSASAGTIFEIISKGNEKSGKVDIKLVEGNTLIKIDNKLPDKYAFEVETPNATMSVRGTTFTASYNSEKEATMLSVSEGTVKIDAYGEERDVVAGEAIVVKEGEILDNHEAMSLKFTVSIDAERPDYLDTKTMDNIGVYYGTDGYYFNYNVYKGPDRYTGWLVDSSVNSVVEMNERTGAFMQEAGLIYDQYFAAQYDLIDEAFRRVAETNSPNSRNVSDMFSREMTFTDSKGVVHSYLIKDVTAGSYSAHIAYSDSENIFYSPTYTNNGQTNYLFSIEFCFEIDPANIEELSNLLGIKGIVSWY